MHFVDTHTHLTEDSLFSRIDDVLGHAVQRGVTRFLVPTYNHASWDAARTLATTYDGVAWAAGIHPLFPESAAAQELTDACTHSRCRAIGEIGLDYVRDNVDKKRQRDLFVAQLAVAADADLPVILHCRKAHDDLREILSDCSPMRGVLHSCSFSAEQIDPFLTLNMKLYVGVSGVITRRRAKKAPRLAAHIPLDTILLETDSPFIGTDTHPAPTSEPADTADVALAVARAKNIPVHEVAEVTTRNALTLFSLPDAR